MPRLGPYPFSPKRGLIRMSWNKRNLFNADAYARQNDNTFNRTVFQTRFKAKQMARGYHGSGLVTEQQFMALFQKNLPPPPTFKGHNLPATPPVSTLTMAFLERRADLTLFRACLAPSLAAAQHMIRKGWVAINGRRLERASLKLEDGDVLRVTRMDVVQKLIGAQPQQQQPATVGDAGEGAASESGSQQSKKAAEQLSGDADAFEPRPYAQPWMFVPEYLEVNYNTLSVCFLRSPTVKPGKCEIPSPFPPAIHGLVYEYYARR